MDLSFLSLFLQPWPLVAMTVLPTITRSVLRELKTPLVLLSSWATRRLLVRVMLLVHVVMVVQLVLVVL